MNYFWTTPIDCTIITRVPFNLLPETAAAAVWYAALVASYVKDIGMEQEVRVWSSEAAAAHQRMEAEHLRNKKYSTMKTRAYGRYRAALRS